jgi:hypothetical protein
VDREYLRRYFRLLVVIVAAFVIEGVADSGKWELTILSVLLGATLLLALHAAKARSSVLRAASYLAVAVVVFTTFQALFGEIDERLVRLTNAIVVAFALLPRIVLGVVRGSARLNRCRSTRSWACCACTPLGMFFAAVWAVDRPEGNVLRPGRKRARTPSRTALFQLHDAGHDRLRRPTAASNLGATLSVSEGLVGQIYLVTIVSWIVSNVGRQDPSAAMRMANAVLAPGCAARPRPCAAGGPAQQRRQHELSL